ncbi:MAG: CDP-diacylglycerol--glycerol-3-phosphate 3-phosphatidyltransferase [Lachnospiraceae bacterium]|nr:CDP-diacylglycerol--glycerol-3-phosphate 3-phosphatidyltransferase [Lachnospiraceae bacterium]
MNLPNKLTILRVIMIPFFLVALLVESIPYGNWIAVSIFIIASLTDTLDGQIARKYNLVTNFGKFMDPIADKLLVCSALIALIELDRISAWVVIIIIGREFIVNGFRLVASDNGVVIAAGWWGKIKTVVQMIMIIVLICNFEGDIFVIIENILIYAALALTIISLLDYLIKNRAVLSEKK